MTDEKSSASTNRVSTSESVPTSFRLASTLQDATASKNEWVKLRSLYFDYHTISTLWHFYCAYRYMCGEILRTFGFRAWFHTPTFDFGED